MRCLTLQQPWATLVACGAKRIETRSWSTPYRGPVAIHASQSFPGWAKDLMFTDPFFLALNNAGFSAAELLCATAPKQPSEILPLGSVIAVADLVDVVRITPDNVPPEPERSFGNYEPGRYAWHLTNVRPLQRPIPTRGALGLWAPAPELLTAIQEALVTDRIHVIRVQTPSCTITMVSKPTTNSAEVLETEARVMYPKATLKPTRSYQPAVFRLLEGLAEEAGLTIDEVIDRREATAQGVAQ